MCLSLSASAYSETKRELKEKIGTQIQALLSEVPCLSFSKDVEGEYLASYIVATSRNVQAVRIAKMESARECLKFRDNNDRTVTAYVVYHLPLKVTVDRIIETMRSYTENERENFKKQLYKELRIKQ